MKINNIKKPLMVFGFSVVLLSLLFLYHKDPLVLYLFDLDIQIETLKKDIQIESLKKDIQILKNDIHQRAMKRKCYYT